MVALRAIAASAQDRPGAIELSSGWAGFADDSVIHHGLIGGAARFYASRRLSIGPELVYLIGPGSDRDLMLTGNLTFDLLGPTGTGARRATPYLVAGIGLLRHTNDFYGQRFASTEGAFTAGGGVRVFLTDRLYIAPEARVGWELHLRIGATVGLRLR